MSEASNILASKPADKAQVSLAEVFTKRGKIVLDLVRATAEARNAFSAFAQSLITTEKQDWSAKAPEFFTTAALVKPESDNLPPRLIAISDREHVFADPIVSARLYQTYVNRCVSAASKDDADPADFVIVSGTYRQQHDMTAFSFQAAKIVSALKQQGVVGMSVKELRDCLSNAAHARALFPRIKDQSWELIFNLMVQKATERGLDTSIFAHWAATRNVKVDEGKEIDLSGFENVVNEKLAEAEAESAKPEAEAGAAA